MLLLAWCFSTPPCDACDLSMSETAQLDPEPRSPEPRTESNQLRLCLLTHMWLLFIACRVCVALSGIDRPRRHRARCHRARRPLLLLSLAWPPPPSAPLPSRRVASLSTGCGFGSVGVAASLSSCAAFAPPLSPSRFPRPPSRGPAPLPGSAASNEWTQQAVMLCVCEHCCAPCLNGMSKKNV